MTYVYTRFESDQSDISGMTFAYRYGFFYYPEVKDFQ